MVHKTEEGDPLFLAPKLQKAKIKPNNFDQMKVTNTTYVINDTIAAALEYFSKTVDDPSLLTTAWFCRKFQKWLTLMTASSPKHALSKKKPEKYAEARAELLEFMEIIRGIVFPNTIL
jgi:hypothetical protein